LIAFDTAKVGKLPTSLLNDEPVSGDSVEVANDPLSHIHSHSHSGGIIRFLLGRVNPMSAKLLTLKEFAVHLGVSYSTVRRMVADKSVRVVTPHRRAMIPESEVDKFTFPMKAVVDELGTGS
jgi:excisionase family DNA binding protein